jgi:hypothetical protein
VKPRTDWFSLFPPFHTIHYTVFSASRHRNFGVSTEIVIDAPIFLRAPSHLSALVRRGVGSGCIS